MFKLSFIAAIICFQNFRKIELNILFLVCSSLKLIFEIVELLQRKFDKFYKHDVTKRFRAHFNAEILEAKI